MKWNGKRGRGTKKFRFGGEIESSRLAHKRFSWRRGRKKRSERVESFEGHTKWRERWETRECGLERRGRKSALKMEARDAERRERVGDSALKRDGRKTWTDLLLWLSQQGPHKSKSILLPSSQLGQRLVSKKWRGGGEGRIRRGDLWNPNKYVYKFVCIPDEEFAQISKCRI